MADSIGPYTTATAMLQALRTREVSSVELVEMHLARIEALDGPLNAIPVRTPERALEAARRADEALAKGQDGPLLGLPMTLKESTQTAGLPQSAGIPDLKEFRPAADGPIAAECVRRRRLSARQDQHPCLSHGLAGEQPCVRAHATTPGASTARPAAAPAAAPLRWRPA